MVAQENIFPFNFTAFEIVLMGRHPFISMLGFEKKQDKEIVKDIMHMLKIDHLANRKFPSLSGGEKQRTLFASALAQTPQLLLLDEPTSAMDVKHQIEIYKILKDLQSKKGLSILTVTHDINTAAMFCDRFILLKEGKVIDTGNPSAVLTKSKIKNLYDIDVSILNHPIYKTPLVFPN
jgi:iron complex transport system ATP-binding protein